MGEACLKRKKYTNFIYAFALKRMKEIFVNYTVLQIKIFYNLH